MPIRPEAWPRAREVFERALALPAADRPSYLDAACGSDHELRRDIERMLESHGQAAGFLSTPPAHPFRATDAVLSLEGQLVGPFLVSSRIGAGGMGEVYRARDSRLKRDVALKILPAIFTGDPDRLARFEREAQALAALNHPNIAAIHGFEVSGEIRALVLELVEGETLADRVGRGAIPVAEALRIARQIAAALEAAHEHGVVHRDLKPANVKITPDGVVKVLDFGLAKLGPSEAAQYRDSAYAMSSSPTITSPVLLTGAGALLGTAAYMAPEQARGRAADKRADIWAFGVVLYEMLTGARAFEGDTVTETIGAVIHKDLDWTRIPADLPPPARLVLRRCLQKDVTERVRDMGDVGLALDGAFTPEASIVSEAAPRRWKRVIGMTSAVLLAAMAGGVAVWWYSRTEPPVRYPIRVDIPSPGGRPPFSLSMSPDGRNLAFLTLDSSNVRALYLHSLETGETSQITNVGGPTSPFWSPDGATLAFGADGKLLRMEVAGRGPAVRICDAGPLIGGTWTSGNVILFADSSRDGIMQVAATGGTPVQRTRVDQTRGESQHVFPWALPGGRRFLYRRASKVPDNDGIFLGSVESAPEAQDLTRLVASEQVAYVPPIGSESGHVLFTRDGLLVAQRFDESRLEFEGEAASIAAVAADRGGGLFTVSANGAVAYLRAGLQSGAAVWVGRNGQTTADITGRLRGIENPRLSSDGASLALIVAREVWRHDLDGRPPIKLTFGGANSALTPLWTRDGTRVIYEARRGLASMPADGSGGMPEPASPPGHFHPHGWTPDGREIVALRWPDPAGKGNDLVRFQPRTDGKVETIVATPAREGDAASISPDGRWLAYTSYATDSEEVYVRPFSQSGTAVRVSPNGGGEPVWARSGKELFYLRGSDMMSVAVETGATFTFKPPTRLFEITSYVRSVQPPSYDVAADGRFVMIKPDAGGETPITVILNWTEGLRQRAAAH